MTGQHIRKKSDADWDTEWVQQRTVVNGNLHDGPLSLDMGGILRFTLTRTGLNTGKVSIRSLSGSRRIDFKRYTLFDNAAIEGNFADDYLLTEDPWVFDALVYTHTRESPVLFVRDISTMQMWKLEAFMSGDGARCRVWAEAIE